MYTVECCCFVPKSCPTVLQPHGLQPTGSSVRGISQTRIPEWVAISFSRGSSRPRDRTCVSFGRWVLYTEPLRKPHNGILTSHKKELNFASFDNMNRPRGYYGKVKQRKANTI